jgi:DNA polymerase
VTRRDASGAGAAAFVPAGADLEGLRSAAAGCRGCDLWRNATQTVFGSGPAGAAIVLVGEQPGDREDREGEPFTGPAGHLLDRALERAGIPLDGVYRTNAVKHFKWERRGKRRIHVRPSRWEVAACGPWLAAELAALTPEVIVLLGATAGQAVFGSGFRVTRQRGRVLESFGLPTIATVHPAAVLRAPEEARAAQMDGLVADLALAGGIGAGTG